MTVCLWILYPPCHVLHLMHEIFIKFCKSVALDCSTLSCPLLYVFNCFFNLRTDFRLISKFTRLSKHSFNFFARSVNHRGLSFLRSLVFSGHSMYLGRRCQASKYLTARYLTVLIISHFLNHFVDSKNPGQAVAYMSLLLALRWRQQSSLLRGTQVAYLILLFIIYYYTHINHPTELLDI